MLFLPSVVVPAESDGDKNKLAFLACLQGKSYIGVRTRTINNKE